MAEFPVFETNSPVNATVRTSRIGPEDPHSPLPDTVTEIGKKTAALGAQIQKTHNDNALMAVHSALAQKSWDDSDVLNQSHFTDVDTYLKQAQDLTSKDNYDPVRAAAQGMHADARTMDSVENLITLHRTAFMHKQTGLSHVRDMQEALNGLPANVDEAAKTLAAAPNDETKRAISDSINQFLDSKGVVQSNGVATLTARDINGFKTQFQNKSAVYSFENLVRNSPETALRLINTNDWQKDEYLQHATVGQVRAAAGEATKALKQKEDWGVQALNSEMKDQLNTLMTKRQNGSLTPQDVIDFQAQSPKYGNALYELTFHKKPPPAQIDPAVFAMYQTRINTAPSKQARDLILSEMDRDSNVPPASHAAIHELATAADAGETQDKIQWKARSNENLKNQIATMGQLYNPFGLQLGQVKGAFNTAGALARARLSTLIANGDQNGVDEFLYNPKSPGSLDSIYRQQLSSPSVLAGRWLEMIESMKHAATARITGEAGAGGATPAATPSSVAGPAGVSPEGSPDNGGTLPPAAVTSE